MRIRNKKTGEIVEWEHGLQYKLGKEYQSVKEFAEDWEDAPEEGKPWKPDFGEENWCIDSLGFMHRERLNDLGKPRITMGNYFRTREDAERAIKWLEARKVLMDDAKGFKPEVGEWYYVVIYDERGLAVRGDNELHCEPCFETDSEAMNSIRNHAEQWKIYLGVEE